MIFQKPFHRSLEYAAERQNHRQRVDYDIIKLHLVVRHQVCRSGEYGVLLHYHYF